MSDPTGRELVFVMKRGLGLDRYVSCRRDLPHLSHRQVVRLLQFKNLNLRAYKCAVKKGVSEKDLRYALNNEADLATFVKVLLNSTVKLTRKQTLEISLLGKYLADDYLELRKLKCPHAEAMEAVERCRWYRRAITVYTKLRRRGKTHIEALHQATYWYA